MARLRICRLCVTFLLCAAAVRPAPAQNFVFQSLHSFADSDGHNPMAALVQGTDGNFYGTTADGGTNCSQNQFNGCGTVFKVTPTGTLTTLHRFNGTDGFKPVAGLVQGNDGSFYGTTEYGGTNCGLDPYDGCGTVFRITPSGTLTTLHSFNGSDGFQPIADLVLGTDGNFYGTTMEGGTTCQFDGCGTAFVITPGGAFTMLHSFCNSYPTCPDGSNPNALVQGSDGNFYGTTAGSNGTVFRISPFGTVTTLYTFSGGTDGKTPAAGLVQGTDGNFYATTLFGGLNQDPSCGFPGWGCGTTFKITPAGTFTSLYSFCAQSNCRDGSNPMAGLVQGTNGNFYGTTQSGGTNQRGTAFQITGAGALTNLYSFCSQSNCVDGAAPYAGLIQARNGNFYGTTNGGGVYQHGSVFVLFPARRPCVFCNP